MGIPRPRVVAALVLIALLGLGACSQGSSGSSGGNPGRPNAGDVFLEPFDKPGPNPFTPSVAFAAIPDLPPTTDRGTVRGSHGGLYAGTAAKSVCDVAAWVASLDSHPAYAQRWADALNTDPTLVWTGGSKLAADDLDGFAAELTPVVLRSDTRLTNFGLVKRRHVAHQAILQEGTAILVDTLGVPRVRCASGSPLTRSAPESKTKYQGDEWEGWSADNVVTINPATEPLDRLSVLDVHTRRIIRIPTGSDVSNAIATTTTTTQVEETTTTTRRRTTTTGPTTTAVSPPTPTVTSTPPATEPETTPMSV